jgi:hypothetical protein
MQTKGRLSILITAFLCLSATLVRADGGVTFTNIAANDGAGITYRRVQTPSRRVILDRLQALRLSTSVPTVAYNARTPNKPHGAPGVAVFDYDNDGDFDIYVTNGPGKANSLYSNQLKETGKVTFVDVGGAAGVAATAQDSSGVCFGDLDNDGFEDLYVTSSSDPSILFHNNGDGTFDDITVEASADFGGGSLHRSGCAMGDFNGDGYLDLVIANTYNDWSRRDPLFTNVVDPTLEHNQLFMQDRTNGKIHFLDASATSGIQVVPGMEKGTYTWGISAVDIDQDGDIDILWADLQGPGPDKPGEDRGYNRLFLNDGTGHFKDATVKTHLDKTGTWMGLAYGDFNCDGNMDFFSTNLGSWAGSPANVPRWFLGKSDGTFSYPGIEPLTALPFGWGVVATDYDNDGDQDLIYYGDDELLSIIFMDNPGTILQNKGCSAQFGLDLKGLKTDHRFREVNGVAKGDFNNDGFDDVATVSMFRIVSRPDTFMPLTVLSGKFDSPFDDIAYFEVILSRTINPGFYTYVPHTILRGDLAVEMNSANNGNGWSKVQLVGSFGTLPKAKSNRDGIGSVIKFTPAGGKTVITPVIGGGSHASQSSSVAGFGLGTAAKGTVDVLWPGGTRNRLYDVARGEQVKIPEIPCSYKDPSFKTISPYNSCVQAALGTLVKKKIITSAESARLFASAQRAFNER